jgi:hypothetical protein
MVLDTMSRLSNVRVGSFSTDPAGFASQLMSGLPQKRPSRDRRSIEASARIVIQAPKARARIMRYELNDYEWASIKPMLPNKPRGVPRVNDRRVLNGIF